MADQQDVCQEPGCGHPRGSMYHAERFTGRHDFRRPQSPQEGSSESVCASCGQYPYSTCDAHQGASLHPTSRFPNRCEHSHVWNERPIQPEPPTSDIRRLAEEQGLLGQPVPDYGALCDALFPDEASRDEFTAYIVRTRHPATTDPVCDHGVPIDEACAECEIIVSGLDIPFTMQAVERAVSDPVQEARKRVGAQMALVFACQDYAESYRDGDENRRMMAARSLDQARDDFRDVMFKAGQQAERDRVAALEGRTTQALVHEFHEAFKLPIGTEPVLLDGDRTGLRYDLIREELEELADAQNSGDLVGIADALADLAYVVFGAAVEYGIDLDRVIREVHRSNMTKLGDDGKAIRREDGKVLKGPHYEPPNVAAALREVKP